MAGSIKAEGRVDELVRKLRASGQRLTPQRLAVLRALVANEDHPSAEQVYREVLPLYPMMSLATVYKTIDVLKDMGEILELEFREGANRYDANIPEPHPHLVCTECGSIQDLDVGDVAALTAQAGVLTGYSGIRTRLDFYGLCPACHPGPDVGS
jgi:Fur family peroxide stress response transcriptional regulator